MSSRHKTSPQESSPHLLRADVLNRVKESQSLFDRFEFLRLDALNHLQRPLVSVLDKSIRPPSGNKRDYASTAIYWWPNPETENGLPYVYRDGFTNPDSFSGTDWGASREIDRKSVV